MSFAEMRIDFKKNRPVGSPASMKFWFRAEKKPGDKGAYDILTAFLRTNHIPYLNTPNGQVWFYKDGQWCTTKHHWSCNEVSFYLCEFARKQDTTH